MSSEPALLYAITIWLGVCAWMDWKQRTVSNWLTLPPICLALLFRLFGWGQGFVAEILGVSLLLAVAWFSHLAGGADIKVNLVLTILNPAFTAWAWGGAMTTYLLLRLVRIKLNQFPGMVGFLIGWLAYRIVEILR